MIIVINLNRFLDYLVHFLTKLFMFLCTKKNCNQKTDKNDCSYQLYAKPSKPNMRFLSISSGIDRAKYCICMYWLRWSFFIKIIMSNSLHDIIHLLHNIIVIQNTKYKICDSDLWIVMPILLFWILYTLFLADAFNNSCRFYEYNSTHC